MYFIVNVYILRFCVKHVESLKQQYIDMQVCGLLNKM